jgi:CO/xanthine dehydrogenase Mo-binding subunit
MTGLIPERELSRRSVLKGGGALIVGFSFVGALAGKAAAAKAPNVPPDVTQVDSFLAINADNSVNLYPVYYEFGQGTWTGFTQVVAEELDVAVGSVKIPLWNSGGPNPFPNWGTNAASNGMANGGPPLRQAAATARQVLLGLASTQLGVAASSLTVSDGAVSGGGRTVKYSDLIAGKLFSTTIAGQPTSSGATAFAPGTPAPLKDPSTYKVVGTRVPRIDIPAKAAGTYTYIQNVRVPGMWHGRPVRARGQAALFGTSPAGGPASFTVVSVDQSSIAHIPNAQVIQKGNFVGVVAPNEYDAIQAAAALKVVWSEGNTLPGSGNLYGAMRSMPTKNAVVLDYGNVDTALASAAKTLSATYEYPFQIHAPIGPCCAIAYVPASGTPTIWIQGQDAWGFRTYVNQVTGVDPNNIQVVHFEGSSTYNPGPTYSCCADAALMSQAIGKPVRVQSMRWDEHGYSPFAQSNVADLRAGLDASGKLVAYDYQSIMMPFSNNPTPAFLQLGNPVPADSASFSSVRGAPDASGVNSNNPPAPGARIETFSSGDQYFPNITNRRVTGKVPQSLFKLCPLRAPTCVQPGFASESFVDEIAYAAGQDPYLYRKAMTSQPLWLGVLDAVATASAWQPRVAHSLEQTGPIVTGRGISIAGETHLMSDVYSAAVAEVEVNLKSGKTVVKHVYGAQDSGLIVNPALVENQLTGMMVRAVSRTLYEGVTFNKQRVTSVDWTSYPILRFAESPTVTAIVIGHTEVVPAAQSPIKMAGPRYRGVGESMEAAVPAAIGNAIFDATGVRMRQVPITPAKMRYALKGGS